MLKDTDNATLGNEAVFQDVFAREAMLPSLRLLFNTVFSIMELPDVKTLQLKPISSFTPEQKDVGSILELGATSSTGYCYNIEVLGASKSHWMNRALACATCGFVRSAGPEENLDNLRSHYVIIFAPYPSSEKSDRWFDYFQSVSTRDPSVRSDSITIIYVRLPRPNEEIPTDADLTPELMNWLRLMTTDLRDEAALDDCVSRDPRLSDLAAVLKDYAREL